MADPNWQILCQDFIVFQEELGGQNGRGNNGSTRAGIGCTVYSRRKNTNLSAFVKSKI